MEDRELFATMKQELFSAVIGDVMDVIGLQNQFLPPALKPLRPDMVIAGRAMPVVEMDIDAPEAASIDPAIMAKPFGIMFEALDDLKEHEVYICTGASPRYALWGELMSRRAQMLGSAGAIVNGYSRDTHGILALGFPTFSCGGYSQDQGPRGKVTAYRVPIRIGGVDIRPGDILFGDIDGVCVVPREHEAAVFEAALEKVRGEKRVAKAIEQGMSACTAFETYGIF